MKLSTAQHTALAAISDVSMGRGKRGLKTQTAFATFKQATLATLLRLGLLKRVESYGNVHYFKTTVDGYQALAA